MTPHAYLGRDAAGQIIDIVADTRDMTLADNVRDMLVAGLDVERVPLAWVRAAVRLFSRDRYWVAAEGERG